MTDKLTEKQSAFLDYLFGEAEGNPRLAAELAGYSSVTVAYSLLRSLKDEIIERASFILAMNSPKAAMTLVEAMDKGATSPSVSIKMNAAQQVLDRIGIVKHDKVDISSDSQMGIFILPAKKDIESAPTEA